jgi:hypothetical protein
MAKTTGISSRRKYQGINIFRDEKPNHINNSTKYFIIRGCKI